MSSPRRSAGVRNSATARSAYPNVTVNDPADITQKAQDAVNQLLGNVTAMLILVVVVAILGIVNTLVLSVVERTRELGLLRAVGWEPPPVQDRRTAGVRADGHPRRPHRGHPRHGLRNRAQPRPCRLGHQRASGADRDLAVYLVIATAVGVLTAIGPARRASKVDVLKAINSE